MAVKNLTFVDDSPPQCDAEFLNSVKGEVNNFITSTGVGASVANLNQVGGAVAEYAGGADFYTDAGSGTAYVLSVVGSKKAPTQYFNGLRIRFVAANANTGTTPTINVAGLGVKNIKAADGSASISVGDIEASKEVQLTYDGTNFRLVVYPSLGAVAAAPPAYISGLVISQDADTDHDIQIGLGTARDAADTQNIALSTVLTKQIDANWTAGDDAGGFPSGLTLSNSTWYHVFVIATTAGTVDAGFDTSLTATNLLSDASGYAAYRRVGAVLTDGSANIIAFTATEINGGGLDVVWSDPPLDVDATAPGTSAVSRTLSTPTGVKCKAAMNALIDVGSSSTNMILYLSNLDQNDETGSLTAAPTGLIVGTSLGGGGDATGYTEVLTNTSSQIRSRMAASNGTSRLNITTLSYQDFRR